jgi:cytochrome c biogenesis protein CcmG, thiol:disulfide interchange protein DsbE
VTVRQQLTAVGVVIAILGLAAVALVRWNSDELFLVGLGSKAPNFHAWTVDGARHNESLDSYRGSVVLLNVWATWCPPCVVEMPAIQRLYHDLGPQGLKVVAVSIDTEATDSAVRAFATKRGLTFDILRDSARRITWQYQTTGVPETFVIGRDGIIRKKVIGASDWDSQGDRALVTQLLREPGS